MKKEYEYCLRCGRKLKNDEARIRGMGVTCWRKHQVEHSQPRLFEDNKNETEDNSQL